MMRRIALLALLATLLAAAPVTAQNATQPAELDVGPGMVAPDSPFYGLEVAWDNAAMSLGLARAGTVVQERAAEARAMQERNNSEAMQRAAREMSRVAERAREGDGEGLQKAAAVLERVMQRAPQQARQGLQTALDSVRGAQERIGAGSGPGGAAGTRPNGTGGNWSDTPGNGDGPNGSR